MSDELKAAKDALNAALEWVNVPMQASDAAGLREQLMAAADRIEASLQAAGVGEARELAKRRFTEQSNGWNAPAWDELAPETQQAWIDHALRHPVPPAAPGEGNEVLNPHEGHCLQSFIDATAHGYGETASQFALMLAQSIAGRIHPPGSRRPATGEPRHD